MKRTIITIMVFITFFSIKTFAQKHTQGYVKYEITDFKADDPDNPQMAMIEGAIKSTKTKLFFTKEKSLTKVTSMMTNTKILVDKAGNSEMYMEMMGQKFLIKMNKADADKISEEHSDKKPNFIHHKDQTKEILGFKTYLVEGKIEGEETASMQFWITTEIETKGVVSQGMDNDKIGGFPLEYTVGIPGQFSMTTKAIKFKEDFEMSVFDFDKTGYDEKTFDDLKGMGMGGGF